ncbi:hypothetical protein [Sphingomonas sp. S-NIH.Pt15_0812]|uniref:hypothetical protein n=1 Tax=Sphingomonas sp. S-NIH.Pt15_0812 TaxID=1920129 RepID=UPI000F7EB259|nr:hypothetical protein [Sphingomonas sp. S-NIH.Pt15_0812]RSU48885.1 hypothetical protein BRX43_11405 [Sphingomonas sp. S-NIH.Pt15_0812]
MSRFERFAAIDWSGARGTRHRGIALGLCEAGDGPPSLVHAPDARPWSRTAIADWIVAHRDAPMLVGMDFSFSAPFVERGAHLPGESRTADARALWALVEAESEDPDLGAADFIQQRRGRHFYLGAADGVKRDFLHWRQCEMTSPGERKPSTVYDAIGAAQVSKASFAGMRLLYRLSGKVAIWPFDPMPETGLVLVEIYTAIAARAAGIRKGRSKIRDAAGLDMALAQLGSAAHYPLPAYDDHATDAILTAAWLRRHADDRALWTPGRLTPQIAATEGWTFGVK